jgi:antitoxin VapB
MAHIMDADDIDAKAIDTLAEDLAKLTGETKAQATAKALAQRLTRERAARNDLTERLAALTARLRVNYDTRPVTKAEWDWASGDED